MLTRVLPENKKIGEHKRWRMKDVSQESVFIFLKKDSVVPEGWGSGFDPEARQYRVVASALCSIWLGAIFFPVRSPWPKMSIFCLLFPVYIVCNYVSNVLQSIRMVLFHITKLNASITSSVVWHEGMRVFRGCKAWWEHKVGRWHTAEGAQLGEVLSMLPVGNSLWNKLSLTSAWCCLREYPLGTKTVTEAEQKILWVSFTTQELHRGGRSAIITIISYCPIPRIILGFLGVLWDMSLILPGNTLQTEKHSSTLLVRCLSDLAADLLVRRCVPCSSIYTQKVLNQSLVG